MDILASTAAIIVPNSNDDSTVSDERGRQSVLEGETETVDSKHHRGKWTQEEVNDENL